MQPTDTRSRILERMFHDIHKNGFQGLRADKVVADMGITKGALYHYFPGKDAIGLSVIEEIIEPNYLRFYRNLAEKTGHPIDALKAHLQGLADAAIDENIALGCPLNNLAQEMSPLSEDFRARLQVVFDAMIRYTVGALEAGKARGQVKPDTNTESVAAFMIAGLEGAYSTAKVKRSAAVFRQNIGQLQVYLDLFRLG
jgi:AcrR family transcriptional regulator